MYFLAGVVPILASFTMLWSVPPWWSEAGRFLYVLVVYLLFDTVLTMVMVPYNALIQEMVPDYNDRSSLTGYRMGFSQASCLLSGALPPVIVGLFVNPVAGYRAMGLLFGLLYALPWLGVFAFSFEPRVPETGERTGMLADVRLTMSNRSFRLLVGIYLLTFLAMDVVSATAVYFITHVLGKPGQVSYILGVLLLSQLLALPLFVRVAHRFDKRATYLAGAGLWAMLMPSLLFVGPGTPIWIVYLLVGLMGFGICGASVGPWAMFPDVLDVDELATGQRRQGVYSGVMTFLRKASSALAIFVVGWGMQLSGYSPGGAQVQPAQFLLAVRWLMALLPMVLIFPAIAVARRFPLTRERHRMIRAELEARYRGEPEPGPAAPGLLRLLYGSSPCAPADPCPCDPAGSEQEPR